MKFQLSEVFGPEKFLTLPFSPQRSTFWARRRFICTGSTTTPRNSRESLTQHPWMKPFLGDQFVVNQNDCMSYHLMLGLKLFIYLFDHQSDPVKHSMPPNATCCVYNF